MDVIWTTWDLMEATLDVIWTMLDLMKATLDVIWTMLDLMEATLDVIWTMLDLMEATLDVIWTMLDLMEATLDLIGARSDGILDARAVQAGTPTLNLVDRCAFLKFATPQPGRRAPKLLPQHKKQPRLLPTKPTPKPLRKKQNHG